MRWEPRWQIPLVALALGIIAFLFTNNYRPRLSLMANIMHAEISWEAPCPNKITGKADFSEFSDATPCHRSIPYRWVLAGLIGVALAGLFWPKRA